MSCHVQDLGTRILDLEYDMMSHGPGMRMHILYECTIISGTMVGRSSSGGEYETV